MFVPHASRKVFVTLQRSKIRSDVCWRGCGLWKALENGSKAGDPVTRDIQINKFFSLVSLAPEVVALGVCACAAFRGVCSCSMNHLTSASARR